MLAVVPVLALFATWLLVRSVHVDRSAGRVVARSLLGRRSVAWSEAARLELVNNRGGGLLLVVGERGSRRSLHLPILVLTDYVKRSPSPQTLQALAEDIERWAPGRATVTTQLRRQARHLESGGSAQDSPLAALVTHGFTTATKGGGAAGATSLLD